MSDSPDSDLSVAWISRGRLFVQAAGQPLREIESAFAKQAVARDIRDAQTNAWKGRSGIWGNLGMEPPGMAPWEDPDPRRQIRFVTLARGKAATELFYVLDMGAVGGLFSYDMKDDIERRFVHRQGFILRDVSRHPVDGDLALSLPREDGTVGLKVTRADGLFGTDIALSDSLDEAPCWLPDGSRRLVFQSAAIGRNEGGYAVGKSAYRIEILDLKSEELKTLHEEEGFDLLQPRVLKDETMIYIRRPYKPVADQSKNSILDIAKDVVFFPYRLLRTFVHFFHFMSVMFSGKPLITAGTPNPNKKGVNPYLMLWGQAVDTQRILSKDGKGGIRTPLVSKDWQLIRRAPDGTETLLAESVLSWDISSDGQIVYTDGRSVYHLQPDGRQRSVVDAELIERIVVLN